MKEVVALACVITREPEALEQVLKSFLKRRERVLVCFPEEPKGLGTCFADMVRRCGGVCVFWGKDLRWKALLRKGFSERCGTIIGPPGVVLGLSKLAKRMGTPLHIRNAILVGEPPDDWMMETICQGLDCVIQGCCSTEEPAEEENVAKLRRELRRWTSILDFQLRRSRWGLALEMVVFPGEKLPRLPSLGRLSIREWDPETETPFDVPLVWGQPNFSQDYH